MATPLTCVKVNTTVTTLDTHIIKLSPAELTEMQLLNTLSEQAEYALNNPTATLIAEEVQLAEHLSLEVEDFPEPLSREATVFVVTDETQAGNDAGGKLVAVFATLSAAQAAYPNHNAPGAPYCIDESPLLGVS